MFGGMTTVIAAALLASSVSYDNTNSGLQSTNVQGAIDEISTKANTWIDPSTVYINGTGKLFAFAKGIIITKNDKMYYIKANNYEEEKERIKTILDKCFDYSDAVYCPNSDYSCGIADDGRIYCTDETDYSHCTVTATGSVSCEEI